jgi:hypothetical protein
MPDLLVRSFTPLLRAFQPCFTQPSFCFGLRLDSLLRPPFSHPSHSVRSNWAVSNTTALFTASSVRHAGISTISVTASSGFPHGVK